MRDIEWQAIRDTMAMPIRLVRLTASPEAIRGRLAAEPTTGRVDDAQQTEAWLAAPDPDEPAPDLVIANDGPIVDTATAILDWTGWFEAADRRVENVQRPAKPADAARTVGPQCRGRRPAGPHQG